MVDQNVLVVREQLIEPWFHHEFVVVLDSTEVPIVDAVVFHRPPLSILVNVHATRSYDADVIPAQYFQASIEGQKFVC